MPGKRHPILPSMEEFTALPGTAAPAAEVEAEAVDAEPEPAGTTDFTDDFAF
jgi:hypothetical protein